MPACNRSAITHDAPSIARSNPPRSKASTDEARGPRRTTSWSAPHSVGWIDGHSENRAIRDSCELRGDRRDNTLLITTTQRIAVARLTTIGARCMCRADIVAKQRRSPTIRASTPMSASSSADRGPRTHTDSNREHTSPATELTQPGERPATVERGSSTPGADHHRRPAPAGAQRDRDVQSPVRASDDRAATEQHSLRQQRIGRPGSRCNAPNDARSSAQ